MWVMVSVRTGEKDRWVQNQVTGCITKFMPIVVLIDTFYLKNQQALFFHQILMDIPMRLVETLALEHKPQYCQTLQNL
jgi:hypothetical protein